MKYGYLFYNNPLRPEKRECLMNMGDPIHSLAVINLFREMGIPEEDIIPIDRYDTANYDGEEVILPLNCVDTFQSFYYPTACFPFAPGIKPVIISYHLGRQASEDEITFYKKHEPVGCRDESTLLLMREQGINAYLSGSLLLTFPRREETAKQNKVFLVDCPSVLLQYMPLEIRKGAVTLTNTIELKSNSKDDRITRKEAEDCQRKSYEQLWRLRDEAKLVITGNLSVATVCLAMGIPVILAKEHNFDAQFGFIDKFLPLYTKEKYHDIDWNPVPQNIEQEKAMVKECFFSGVRAAAKDKNSSSDARANEVRTKVSDMYENRQRQVEYSYGINTALSKLPLPKDKPFRYAIWGVCSYATFYLYEEITQNFPDAVLVNAIDEIYITGKILNVDIICPDQINDLDKDVIIFVTSRAAFKQAKELLLNAGRPFALLKNINTAGYYFTSLNPDAPQAHKDVLELLEIVHSICVDNRIVYTLVGAALACYCTGTNFAKVTPNVSIALLYPEYKKLMDVLSKDITEDSQFKLVNMDNTVQFDTLATWLVKKGKVKLPPGRECDEHYYCTHISIYPVFYTGNTRSEWKNIRKKFYWTMESINSRASRPQHSIITKIKYAKRFIKRAIYLKSRHKYSVKSIMYDLGKKETPTAYTFCPAVSSKKSYKITAKDYSTVKTACFAGVNCFVPEDIEVFMQNGITSRQIRNARKKFRSDLLLKGRENLRRVQLIQTEMLAEFDRICRKNNLKYNIAFGNLLSAVRHKGFIPWDDDIDVIMPYEDYMKLDIAMENDLDKEKFFWRTQDTEKDFNLCYKHLKRNGTVYMKPGRDKFQFHKGVLIDVFPVFNAAGNRLTHWFHTIMSRFFRTATWAYMGADNEKKLVKGFYYRQLAKIGNKKAYAGFIRFANIFKKNKGYYAWFGAGMRSPYHVSYLTPECFDDPIELEFEGLKLLAPRKYEEALAYCFGKDYMMYPPVKERFPQHMAIIELGDLFLFDKENHIEQEEIKGEIL